MENITFVQAMLRHVKLESESLTQFRHQLSTLTVNDKEWFKQRFVQEYQYNLIVT